MTTTEQICNTEFRESSIYVCSLNKVNDIVTEVSATHLITLINNDSMIDTPECIDHTNHLRLGMNDISEPVEGLVLPNRDHVTELIEFTKDWHQQAPIVIHCWAGISRSTAAAFISLCALNPDADELSIARTLRKASPSAQPNRRLVSIADKILTRNNRMNNAIEDIGQGTLAHEGRPFSISHRIA